MNDDRIVELLTEIRDLQRTHLDRYQEALDNQAESIEAQKGAIDYQRTVAKRLALLIIPLVVIFLILALGTMFGVLR
jgi:hypothetical protein